MLNRLSTSATVPPSNAYATQAMAVAMDSVMKIARLDFI